MTKEEKDALIDQLIEKGITVEEEYKSLYKEVYGGVLFELFVITILSCAFLLIVGVIRYLLYF